MAEKLKAKRAYTRRSGEERQLAIISKLDEDITKLENKLVMLKEAKVDAEKKLEEIRSKKSKANHRTEEKEMSKLLEESGITLEQLKAMLTKVE